MVRLRWLLLLLLAVAASAPVTFAGKPAPPPGPEPDWTIVFVSSLVDRMELVLTVPDGSARKVLHSAKNVHDTGPGFTPDGRHVVFASDIGGVAGIYAIRLKDGLGQPSIGAPTLLATVTPWSRSCHPTVSPEHILAFSDQVGDDQKRDVHAMGVLVDEDGDLRPDPSLPRRNLTNTPDLYEVVPSWSIADPSSARRLAFSRYDSLATLTCNGLDCTDLAEVTLDLGPGVSVSGGAGWSKITPGLIAFGYVILNTGTSPDLYFIDLDRPELQGRLTNTQELGRAENAVSWAPASDNRILAFAQRTQDGLVIFEDVVTRMVSGPGGAETIVAMPTKRTIHYEEPDWRR